PRRLLSSTPFQRSSGESRLMQIFSRTGIAPPNFSLLQTVSGALLAPLPLAVLQPMFTRIAQHVARSRPELFARLGTHVRKRFLIDPIDLPFVLVLIPDAEHPHLRAYRRYENPIHDASIAGTFFNLLDMIDGACDGDALFFSRDLRVSGDTEAVVALRNALDDFDGSALDSVVGSFGPLSAPAALAVSGLRAMRGRSGHG
ncbi:MAG TPA: SCP2 sterol-binding domain-containing protein, partial [Burkholderiales bacterium]|nr:SCP2 sterol-binding domain-containing protein [Burkholderiales bacterium]